VVMVVQGAPVVAVEAREVQEATGKQYFAHFKINIEYACRMYSTCAAFSVCTELAEQPHTYSHEVDYVPLLVGYGHRALLVLLPKKSLGP